MHGILKYRIFNEKLTLSMEKSRIVESLDVVGEVFGDIKSACIKGFYTIETKRLNEMAEIIRCIKLYAILNDIEKLRGRKIEILGYYLLDGYNKKTKKDIIKRLDLTDSNLNNINCGLRDLGVIHSVNYNQSDNEVDKDLIEFKEFVVDRKGSYILTKIK